MKQNKFNQLLKFFLILILISSLVIVVACTSTIFSEITNNKLSYVISSCNHDDTETYNHIKITKEKVLIHQKISYVCCANLTLNYTLDEDTLNIYINNEGDMCKCICNYEINATIFEKNIQDVKIYGVKYKDIQSYEFIAESSFAKSEEISCEFDSDCVRQSSCCDCNEGYYVNKKYYKEQNCQVVCMCMAVPSVGKCIDSQCTGVASLAEEVEQ